MINTIRRFFASNTLAQPSAWMFDTFGANKSASGASVNEQSAIQLAAVYACVDRLSSGVAALPLITYRRRGDDKERAQDYPLFDVLRWQPNRWQTAFEFFQWVMNCCVYKGNSFSFIVRENGAVSELIPINPEHISLMVPDDGTWTTIGYQYRPSGRDPVVLLPGEVFHVRGMPTNNPVLGTSIISAQREVLGAAIATNEQASKQFSNGSKLSGIIKVPTPLNADQSGLIREEWERIYGGSTNAYKVAVLGADADFKPISMTAGDAQTLETRKLDRSVIAGMFNVPPHMIADNENSTFSNIEHQDLSFAKHTLRPWLVRIEQAVKRDLMTRSERKKYYAEFLIDHLLRGDFESRQRGFQIQIQNGIRSPNEVRKIENINPREGGDVFLTPLNMRESGPDAKPIEPEPPPEPTPSPTATALLQETAERAAKRNASAVKKAIKSSVQSSDFSNVLAAVNKSEQVFTEVLGSTIRVVSPELQIDDVAAKHMHSLSKALSGLPLDDNLLDAAEPVLIDWQKQAVSNLLEQCQC